MNLCRTMIISVAAVLMAWPIRAYADKEVALKQVRACDECQAQEECGCLLQLTRVSCRAIGCDPTPLYDCEAVCAKTQCGLGCAKGQICCPSGCVDKNPDTNVCPSDEKEEEFKTKKMGLGQDRDLNQLLKQPGTN